MKQTVSKNTIVKKGGEPSMPPLISQIQNSNGSASQEFISQLNATKSGGIKMPEDTRDFMQNAFSADFSNVKIHTGPQAAQMNNSIQARAFTQGNDIYFNNGEYDPESNEGKKLLAHELTHVVQQDGSSSLIQRKLSLPQHRSRASAYGRRNELINELNAQSPAIQYSLSGDEITYTVVDATKLTHFDQKMKEFIDAAENVPMRLVDHTGYVDGDPLFTDSFDLSYVDLDDMLTDDKFSFQSDLMHFLTERFFVRNYERRRTVVSGTPQFDRAHRAGKEAEAELLRALLNDASIEFSYVEKQKGGNTWINAFKSKTYGYRVFQIVQHAKREIVGGEMFAQLSGSTALIPFTKFKEDWEKKKAAAGGPVAPKLQVGSGNSAQEQQADAMAEQVVRNHFVTPQTHFHPGSSTGMDVPPSFSITPGNSASFPLPDNTRDFMQTAFSADFSKVRIHTGSEAEIMNNAIQARAFTYKNDIYFNNNEFAPEHAEGKKLLAHELTHVVQQRSGDPYIQRFEARMHEGIERIGLSDPPSGPALSAEENSAAYFGNWMRDMNQAFVPLMQKLGIPDELLFSAISYLAAKKFGRILTPEQFGYYIPSEHIDNPGGLVAKYDLRPTQPKFTAPLVPGAATRPAAFDTKQESVDPLTGKVLGANIFSVDQTGTMAFIRRTNLHVERRLDLATQAGRTPEGLMHFGAALHAIEDLFAHSNWVEIAVSRVLKTNPGLLPALTGAQRSVFTYSPDVNVGKKGKEDIRPVLTTGTFTGTDTQVSLSSELVQMLLAPLKPPATRAEVKAEQQFVYKFLKHFENNFERDPKFRAGILKIVMDKTPFLLLPVVNEITNIIMTWPIAELYLVSTWLPPIIPEEIRLLIQAFIRDQLSTLVLQPLGHLIQSKALDARIASTSLIKNLEDNRATKASPAPTAEQLEEMKKVEEFTGVSIADQHKAAVAQATDRVSTLEATPEAVLAGPSHSQIAKDHPNSPFFGVAFTIAKVAVSRMAAKMIAAWDELFLIPSFPFDFNKPNFPGIPHSPATHRKAGEEASDLFHQTRGRRNAAAAESFQKAQKIYAEGGAGAPYDLAQMRNDSAQQLREAAALIRTAVNSPGQVLGKLLSFRKWLGDIDQPVMEAIRKRLDKSAADLKKSGSNPTMKDFALLAPMFDAGADLVAKARTYQERSVAHIYLNHVQTEALNKFPAVNNSTVSLILMLLLMQAIDYTQPAYLPEQRDVLRNGAHIAGLSKPVTLTQSTVDLPALDKDFAGAARKTAHAALIAESRLLLNHPYENNWWEAFVIAYIKAKEKRIMNDIEARNEGVPVFRR